MMLRIYPEQLYEHLSKELRRVYLLFGNSILLLQESQEVIRKTALIQGFKEHYEFQLDNSVDWNFIFSICKSLSLFSSRQILQISISDRVINSDVNKKIKTLISLLHKDILLIIKRNKIAKIPEKSDSWINQLISNHTVLVTCQIPERNNLQNWIFARAKKNLLQIDEDACQLLCHCYEGNLVALSQTLERLTLLWPDRKLTFHRVQQAVHNAAHFTPFQWIDSLLDTDSNRAFYILKQLKLEDFDPIILVRILQRELLSLLMIKRYPEKTKIPETLDNHLIWKKNYIVNKKVVSRLNKNQLYQAFKLMANIEITMKQDHNHSVWPELENISLIICRNTLIPKVFIDS